MGVLTLILWVSYGYDFAHFPTQLSMVVAARFHCEKWAMVIAQNGTKQRATDLDA